MNSPLPQREQELETLEEQQPLPIVITTAGSNIVRLHGLLRQVLPLLENGESVPDAYRAKVIADVRAELECCEEEEPFPITDSPSETDDYEPGCLLEEEPWLRE